MKTRENALETLRLITAILRRIPRAGRITAQRLREQLAAEGMHRDVRSIQRHLEALSADPELGLERDDSSKPYGYSWAKGARGFSVMSLTPQEALLLRLAERQLKSLLPAKLMKSMDGIFEQAFRQLNDQSPAQSEKEWLGKVRVVSATPPMKEPKIDPEVFEEISNALFGNLWLDMDYQTPEGRRIINKVMPLGLVQQEQRLYLVCRYLDKGKVKERPLALHRFRKAQASTQGFERPADFSLEKAEAAAFFGWGSGQPIDLVFWASKRLGNNLLETPLLSDQKVEEMDGGYRVSVSVLDSRLLQQWLRGQGKEVRVLKPVGLLD